MKLIQRSAALVLAVALGAHAQTPHAHAVGSSDASQGSSGSQQAQGETTSTSSGAHHHGDGAQTGLWVADVVLDLFQLGAILADDAQAREQAVPVAAAADDDDRLEQRMGPRGYRYRRPRTHEARQGMLFSFGVGAGSLKVSPRKATGAFDLDLRLGYGFSDRFQFFGDLSLDAASYADGTDLSAWTLTARGQTVLVGDRAGNGLNLNFGIGLGGVSESVGDYYGSADSPAGLALVGGLSYDARVGPNFALSPELFFAWHQVPNARADLADDISRAIGLRMNFLWYFY